MNFTLPPFARFMRPHISKRAAPRLHHFLVVWILLSSIHGLTSLFDADIDRPATVGNVTEMLRSRDVAFLPSVECLVAKEAGDAVFARG